MSFTGSRLVAMGVMGLVLLVGCGGDDDKPSPTSTLPTTTTAAPVTTTTVSPEPTTVPQAVATTRPSTPQTTAAPVALDCPEMVFNENGEDAAYNVVATGLSCEEANGFIKKVHDTLTAVGPAEADLEGFHCVRTGTEEFGMPSSDYRCTTGAKKVTFARS